MRTTQNIKVDEGVDVKKVLSIIVPSYNMEKYLPRCLGSLVVAPEMMGLLEVLIVNDGSKDRTSEIAHEFATKHPNTFRVIDKANGHYGSCVNEGLRFAKGTYVKILDADDSFDRTAFGAYMRFLVDVVDKELMCAPDMIWNDLVWVDENDVAFKKSVRRAAPGRMLSVDDESVDLSGLYMHQVAYKVENLRKIEYRQSEGICYTDNEWCYLPVATARRVVYCDQPVYRYLYGRTGQSMENAVRIKNLWMLEKVVLQMAKASASVRNVTPKIRQYLIDYFLTTAGNAYTFSLLEVHSPESDARLGKLDADLLKCAPDLFWLLDERVYSHKIAFHYIGWWRRTGNSRTLVLRIFRAYHRFCKWVISLNGGKA